ncbi:hypothetical protein ACRS6B_28505 [Nocardia asteroides]
MTPLNPQPSPRPDEHDVHLSIQFHDVRLNFAACATAAARFIQDWRAYHYPDAVTVILGVPIGLPRLPNERLYLDPP